MSVSRHRGHSRTGRRRYGDGGDPALVRSTGTTKREGERGKGEKRKNRKPSSKGERKATQFPSVNRPLGELERIRPSRSQQQTSVGGEEEETQSKATKKRTSNLRQAALQRWNTRERYERLRRCYVKIRGTGPKHATLNHAHRSIPSKIISSSNPPGFLPANNGGTNEHNGAR
jgi:hypothetical protein